MKRTILFALSLLLLSVVSVFPSLAALVKYKDWEKSPESVYLATDDEKKGWKKVDSDEGAEKFIALFWARRHPNIETTPQNVFREQFEARVKFADERFALGKRRGALTERGRALILIGLPKSSATKAMLGSEQPFGSSTGAVPGTQGAAGGTTVMVQWLYEKPQLPAWADLPSLDLKFEVDQTALVEHLIDASAARRLEKKAAEVALVNPSRKDLPVYKTKEQVAAEQKAAAEKAAEESKGPALSDGARATLDGLAKEPFGALSLLPVSYRDGATRLMVQIYAPASAAGTGEGAKLLILARDKDGKDAVRLEEAAALRKTRSDFFADRVFRIVPGDYDVAAALVDAAGKVLVSARRPVMVPALPTDFAASPLLVAVNDFPVDAPKPDEPFTFSARHFVVRGDGRIDPADGLSYAVRLYNPPVDPVSRTITLKRTVKIKPKGQPAIEVPTPPEEPEKVPEHKEAGAIVLDIGGGVVESNLGQYFRPGDYELRLTLTDPATQKKLEVVTPFTVVGPAKK
jgi:GWxTD domain-containing protein